MATDHRDGLASIVDVHVAHRRLVDADHSPLLEVQPPIPEGLVNDAHPHIAGKPPALGRPRSPSSLPRSVVAQLLPFACGRAPPITAPECIHAVTS